ncbi:MAG: hypothetical protein ACP5U2_10000 [Bryobacteraceae bacterium]
MQLAPNLLVDALRERSRWIRRRSLRMVHRAGFGHPGADLSAADILAVLYFAVLRVDPRNPQAPGRDRFILSKGHGSAALYATLAAAGFIAEQQLDAYLLPLSPSTATRIATGFPASRLTPARWAMGCP